MKSHKNGKAWAPSSQIKHESLKDTQCDGLQEKESRNRGHFDWSWRAWLQCGYTDCVMISLQHVVRPTTAPRILFIPQKAEWLSGSTENVLEGNRAPVRLKLLSLRGKWKSHHITSPWNHSDVSISPLLLDITGTARASPSADTCLATLS